MLTPEESKYLLSLPLELKIQKTQVRIMEWGRSFNWNVYVAFSGGLDSTVLRDLVNKVASVFGNPVPSVFCDTGIEHPEVRRFALQHADEVIKPNLTFREIIQKYGFPVISKEVAHTIYGARRGWNSHINKIRGVNKDGSPSVYKARSFAKYAYLLDAPFAISDKCCDELKKKPFRKYETKTGRKPFTGSMATESKMRMTAWKQRGCNHYATSPRSRNMSNPLSYWTSSDVRQYILEFGIAYADKVYGDIISERGKYITTGASRTGCVACAFGAHLDKSPNRFERLKQSHPNMYKCCVEDTGLGGCLDFLGIAR
ncbi:MAG: phosphoadenosine phosphosulfate reductase family protein [Thermoguttaceae bacterium]